MVVIRSLEEKIVIEQRYLVLSKRKLWIHCLPMF